MGTKRRPRVRKRRTRPEEKPLSMAREDGPGMAARMVARMRKAKQTRKRERAYDEGEGEAD